MLPSRASSVARCGSVVRRPSVSPGRRPGKASERDHATRTPSPCDATWIVNGSESTPNSRVFTRTGTVTLPAPASRAWPTTRELVAVAVASACVFSAANCAGVSERCVAGSRSEYIVA